MVCQAKFNNCLTYLVSMYLDQDILDLSSGNSYKNEVIVTLSLAPTQMRTAQFGTAQTQTIEVSSLRTS